MLPKNKKKTKKDDARRTFIVIDATDPVSHSAVARTTPQTEGR